MKVQYTNQAIASLEEALYFLLYKQRLPKHTVLKIHKRLLKAAEGLIKNPYGNQTEPNLISLGWDIEGWFLVTSKSSTGFKKTQFSYRIFSIADKTQGR